MLKERWLQLEGLLNRDLPLSPEYIAGFFDGEGTVVNTKRTIKSGADEGVFWQIGIFNSDREILEHIHQMLGFGSVETRPVRKSAKVAGRKPMSALRISGARNIMEFIAIVGPYARVKKRKLRTLLETILNHRSSAWSRLNLVSDQELAELHRSHSYEEIGKMYGAAKASVAGRFRRAGMHHPRKPMRLTSDGQSIREP